jgi:DNA polymerase III alpha subunit
LPPSDFLRRLVLEGLRQRYGPRASQFQSQVMEELGIISEVGYEEYFLITWDFLQECRRRGIEWITRGSAADSLVCYCLGISGVCPIRFDLYFRRFLNKDRMALNKLPDIDIDFAHDLKDDVVKLIFDKYGPDHCAVVGGFSTFQARSAFAEVAKVLGVAEREVRKFTDHFPWSFGGGWIPDEHTPSGGAGLIELLRASPENRDLPLDEEPYRTALQMAEFLDGVPRYPKMHPCGLVLSRQPMHELTPTFISNKGLPTAHFDMDAVEDIGLVKMDILAQGGLAVMRDVKEMLQVRSAECGVRDVKCGVSSVECRVSKDERAALPSTLDPRPSTLVTPLAPRPSPLNLDALEPWTDPAVWEMITSGQARAVHHIESPAMTSLCRMCNVNEIDGLIAIVSVIRPGAANEGKKLAFTRRYQGLEPVSYPHPSLEACLRSTYGLVVYEEHILQLCEAFAGLSPGRADVLRRALNKQRRAVIGEIRGEFFASALARGHSPEKTAEVWDLVTGFAGYAFCKAHSTAYGVEAYQAAWLKRYFPAEFMAAVLTNGKGFYDPLVYVLECHRLGIPLLPPSVNEPGPAFSVQYSVISNQYPVRIPDLNLNLSLNRNQDSGADTQRSTFNVQGSTFNVQGSKFKVQGSKFPLPPAAIRVPLTRLKGLTTRTADAILEARERGPFDSLADFFHRIAPAAEELEAMIRAGAFDLFGQARTRQFWQAQHLLKTFAAERGHSCPQQRPWGKLANNFRPEHHSEIAANRNVRAPSSQGWLIAPPALEQFPDVPLNEPTRLERLQWETDLFGFTVSGHPLELYPDIAWDTYCPIARLGEHFGQQIVTCGLVVEQRTHHQITGEPMKFLTIADWTGMVETELFAKTYKSYGLNTIRYRVLEIAAKVEPFENGGGFTLRVLRAGKPRTKGTRGRRESCNKAAAELSCAT